MMFSVGMVVLEMCTLQESSKLYEGGEVNEKALSTALQSIKLTFSATVFEFVSKLCTVDERQRLKVEDVYGPESPLIRCRQGTHSKLQIN